MRTLLLAIFVLVSTGLAKPVRADIDFTLAIRHEAAGSPNPENQYITDGENHIYLRVPRDWRAVSGSQRLAFQPPQTGSEVAINQVRGVQALPLDAPGLEALRKEARAQLPEGSKNIESAGETNDLLPIFGWKSFEVCYRYEFYGQSMQRGVLCINMLPGRVVRVTVTAAAADFEAIHEATRKLMFGWFEPKRDLNPEQARQYEAGEISGS